MKETMMSAKLRKMEAEALSTGDIKIAQWALGYKEVCQYIGYSGKRPIKSALELLKSIVNINTSLSFIPGGREVCGGMEEAIRDSGCELYEDPELYGIQVRYIGVETC